MDRRAFLGTWLAASSPRRSPPRRSRRGRSPGSVSLDARRSAHPAATSRRASGRGCASSATSRARTSHRVPIGGGQIRAASRASPPSSSVSRSTSSWRRPPGALAAAKSATHDPDRHGDVGDPVGRARRQPRAAGRQRHGHRPSPPRSLSANSWSSSRRSSPSLPGGRLLRIPANRSHRTPLKEAEAAARPLAVQLQVVAVRARRARQRLRGDDQERAERSPRSRRPDVLPHRARDRRARGEAAGCRRCGPLRDYRGGRRPDVLLGRFRRSLPPRRHLRRQDPQGREARRPARSSSPPSSNWSSTSRPPRRSA